MKLLSLLATMMLTSLFTAQSAEKDSRVFEMRTYYAAPGKLDALHARFRDHTMALFTKHNITNIGYWVPIENTESKLVYVLSYPNREARDSSWKEFAADPDWKKAHAASEVDGKLVAKVEQLFMTATDFSPEIKPSVGQADRVFELRTYTTTSPETLALLHSRFRDHTIRLFTKYGMTNLFYWQLTPDQAAADRTLVYLLAHASVDAAKTSFDAFRLDPAWVAAKTASETKGGGSLTIPDGVKSVFMKATDYSPTK
ncbi:MAG: family containing protein [Chthoniobacteraceae bacterium]|nr:family containing protein [Chthoniobacteraceae bacterium]MDB6175395.1 family containing protein [Chthoniobacteraceae bacterium]